ncbi:MAG: hypothetical protein JWR19_1370 [Pedosphaera sp.]|nr:hypothetical protein [Pedosphaera sp.]
MPKEVVLHAVNEDGTRVLVQILTPFFATLLPGFTDRAEEIRLSVFLAETGAHIVSVNYVKRGATFPLKPQMGFDPPVALRRIRILSGMSILPNLNQTGKMQVRFGDVHMPIDVQLAAEAKRETLILRPQWQ